MKFLDDGFAYPDKVFAVPQIHGVFITHAHLDHCGALPFFEHHNLICPILMTPVTKPLVRVMLRDSYKIQRIKELHPAWGKTNLKEVKKAIKTTGFDTRRKFGKIAFTFLNAGHIPGSASILIEAEGKRILYTGDINTRATNLMIATRPELQDLDVVIPECTYGARLLPPREPLETEFLDHVARIVKQGGRVLIPVFALGRAQEILLILAKRGWPVPIYFDGMAKQLTRKIVDSRSPYLQNIATLSQMFLERVEYVSSEEHREKVAREPGIFVSTSGMLQGGPAIHYLRAFWHDPKSAVLLTGYQIHHTRGWQLDTNHEIYLSGWKTAVQCEVKRYDFSGHLDSDDLHRYLLALKPKRLFLNHGNEEAIDAVKAWAERQRAQLQWEVTAPHVGDEYEF